MLKRLEDDVVVPLGDGAEGARAQDRTVSPIDRLRAITGNPDALKEMLMNSDPIRSASEGNRHLLQAARAHYPMLDNFCILPYQFFHYMASPCPAVPFLRHTTDIEERRFGSFSNCYD